MQKHGSYTLRCLLRLDVVRLLLTCLRAGLAVRAEVVFLSDAALAEGRGFLAAT